MKSLENLHNLRETDLDRQKVGMTGFSEEVHSNRDQKDV